MLLPIPSTFPFPPLIGGRWSLDLKDSMEQFKEKEIWNDRGMYAFVSWEWVEPFANWIGNRKVLEVMAGARWLARALQEKGIAVIATDDHSWKEKRKWHNQTEIIKLCATEAITQFGAVTDVLIISWPYMDSDAFHAITKWHEINPEGLIVYIGEGEGGCTANDEFFEHFEEIRDHAFEIASGHYRTWEGLHDTVMLGKYRP